MNGNSPVVFRAIRGPLLLITLGTLFAIDHFGQVSIWRTWPVLLIVLGVLKLVEFAGSHTGGPTGGGV
jgi:hypothetical protein